VIGHIHDIGSNWIFIGFGLELSLTIDVGNCPLSSVNRGTWLTKTSLYDLPANHSSWNELGSSNALVSTNGNDSPVVVSSAHYFGQISDSFAFTPDEVARQCGSRFSKSPLANISGLFLCRLGPK
jgi:hypothetical protein